MLSMSKYSTSLFALDIVDFDNVDEELKKIALSDIKILYKRKTK